MSGRRIAVGGGGLTGAFTALLLHRARPDIHITVWEKSLNAGRLFTKKKNDRAVDMGAQYITQQEEIHKRYYSELLQRGILGPFPGVIEGEKHLEGTINYMAAEGMDTIVKYCLTESGCDVLYNTHLTKITMESDNATEVVTLESARGYVTSYDALVITIPVPQILVLDGILPLLDLQQELKENLKSVSYSSRYAVALHFDSNFMIPVPWTAKYVSGNDVIRFVCWDSMKRNPNSGGAPSLLVHSTVGFALEHLEEERGKVEDKIITQTETLFPWLPKPIWSRCHRWRYSQVTNSYPGKPGFLTIATNPPVILCGDGFTQSNFDGCIESAEKVVNALVKLL